MILVEYIKHIKVNHVEQWRGNDENRGVREKGDYSVNKNSTN